MLKRYYYRDNADSFINKSDKEIIGALASHHNFSLDIQQRNAWQAQIVNLKQQLAAYPDGEVFFEFAIPRMGKRVDVVLVIEQTIFVVEYKAGASNHPSHARDQVLDYALDLKNFHEASHSRPLVPIVVASAAPNVENIWKWHDDDVAEPLLSNGSDLAVLIQRSIDELSARPSHCRNSTAAWAESGYKPTPTIVEAAQALYQGHNVEEISRSDAGAANLSETADCIFEIIDHSRHAGRKSICFVTGVPGAGKTLAGLNISTRKVEGTEEHAVFLSGNGPLVTVLREALARDEALRAKASGKRITKEEAHQKVSAFIQNIHHFRDESLRSDEAPSEHVVVFDEAQRAWNRESAEKFMVQKRGATSFEMSEPEFLISVMDRRTDWATIVCLIGGGQEINTGEAGLTEWFDALKRSFPNWDVYHSGQLTNPTYTWGEDLAGKLAELNATERQALHLAVSIRSFRAEKLSDFVGAIIDGDAPRAKDIYGRLGGYHLAITRDNSKARSWLRSHARGTERMGLVASSGGLRLRPEGVFVKAKIDPANWFLNSKDDVRSSYFLEEAATEFDIQGLELDWTGVCWDADLRREVDGWGYYDFVGAKWQNVNDRYRRVYRANAYRVLLTRARQGMVIFVPAGDPNDATRPPHYYDQTFAFLRACGLEEL